MNQIVASGSVTLANMRISAVNGTAFVDFGSLVTNGLDWTGASGATQPTGWTVVNAGLWDIIDDGGTHTTALRVKVDATPVPNPRIKQSLATIIGQKYKFSFDFKHVNGHLDFRLGSTEYGTDYEHWHIESNAGWTTYSKEFTATTAMTYYDFYFESSVDGEYSYVDLVTCTNLTNHLGNLLVISDSTGHTIQGNIKAAGSSETKAAAKDVDGITKANPGVLTLAAGHGYANYNLVYFSGLTEMTDLNTKYRVLVGNSGDTFQVGNTSTYAAAETTGGNCIQLITTPSATGVTITSTKGGSTYNWSAKDSAFIYNDASGYTYRIYKTPNVLILSTTFTAANARNSFDATTAFCEASGLDLSTYAGTDAGSTPYLIELQDASGDVAWGFGGAIGGGEDLDDEKLLDPTFDDTTKWAQGAGWVVNGGASGKAIATATVLNCVQTAGVVCTVGALSKLAATCDSYTSGNVYLALPTKGSVTNASYNSTGIKTLYESYSSGTSCGLRGYGTGLELTASFTDISLKKVLDCAVTGLHIMSARNGTDRGWKTIGSTFNANDAMTIRVYFLGS
jgi:hypothetical protein